jgi:hypothetical protein
VQIVIVGYAAAAAASDEAATRKLAEARERRANHISAGDALRRIGLPCI